jgi:hypothetical protein
VTPQWIHVQEAIFYQIQNKANTHVEQTVKAAAEASHVSSHSHDALLLGSAW